MADSEIKQVPLKDLKMEEAAEELMDSTLMQPYLRVAEAIMAKKDSQGAIAAVAALPLQNRYVWRVASALKWAFADFDSLCVATDRHTLSPEDREEGHGTAQAPSDSSFAYS